MRSSSVAFDARRPPHPLSPRIITLRRDFFLGGIFFDLSCSTDHHAKSKGRISRCCTPPPNTSQFPVSAQTPRTQRRGATEKELTPLGS